MPRINLLPWRDQVRKERQRKFNGIAAGTAVVSALLVVLGYMQISGKIEEQQARNKFLEETIAEVDKQIAEIQELKRDKASMLARMNVIQQLQSSRPEIVHLFDELAKNTPDEAFLLKLDRAGELMKIEGVAESNAAVSAFMRNLDASPWLKNPRLAVIDTSKKEHAGASWFNLDVSQQAPAATEVTQ